MNKEIEKRREQERLDWLKNERPHWKQVFHNPEDAKRSRLSHQEKEYVDMRELDDESKIKVRKLKKGVSK